MPSKSKKSSGNSSGVLAASERIVNSGASKLKSGVNTVGRSLGRLTEYLEGPFTLVVVILVIVLGIYAVVKLWKYERCKVSQRMDASSVQDVMKTHAKKFDDVYDDDPDNYPDDADGKCAVAFQYLRTISGTYGEEVADGTYRSMTGKEDGEITDDLEQTMSDAIQNVRYFCDRSRISDAKLNACDALEAWGSENRVRSFMASGSDSLATTYGATALARAEKDATFKSQLTGQSLTADASFSDASAQTKSQSLYDTMSDKDVRERIKSEMASYDDPDPSS